MEETLNTPIEEVIETEAELVPAEEGETTPEELPTEEVTDETETTE